MVEIQIPALKAGWDRTDYEFWDKINEDEAADLG